MENMKYKGQMGLVFFFVVLFLIVIVGFMGAMIVAIIDFSSDTITPIMTDLGMIDQTNMSEIGEVTFGTLDKIVQNLDWLMGITYVGALLFSIVFALSSNESPNPAFIGIYFALMLVLIMFCIIMSNAYESIYTGGDEIATRLQEQTITSYMTLHSPTVMIIIAFITGIFLFTRQREGGFDV